MCTIKLQPIMEGRSFPDSGDALFQMIEEKLPTEEKIILDMVDVVSLPSMFLNVSIGKFIENHGIELLKKKIAFANISTSQIERLKVYINSFTISR
jgi:hypothetical protein